MPYAHKGEESTSPSENGKRTWMTYKIKLLQQVVIRNCTIPYLCSLSTKKFERELVLFLTQDCSAMTFVAISDVEYKWKRVTEIPSLSEDHFFDILASTYGPMDH